MSATVTPTGFDRSDFRTVVTGGVKLSLIIGVMVVLYLVVSRYLSGVAMAGGEVVLVLAGGVAMAFLPAQWSAARTVEGIAGAAATGLCSTVAFAVIDVAILRPAHAYPWTWDDFGGGTTWWYLPMWWMLGTFLSWQGGIVSATQAGRGEERIGRIAAPVVIGAVIIAAILGLAKVAVVAPVAAGIGFVVSLVVRAIIALARGA